MALEFVTSFPREIREEHVWIAMSDGVRLAGRLWLPVDAEDDPIPAVLEYIPYRKRDDTATRDEMIHKYFAGHGYASIRVDMRGSGDSEGLLMDEYLPLEQQDGLTVIQWLAEQSWCSGAVGMMGLSWGGITALQMATHNPPALKAIIPVGASVDRYYDDGCYFVGCWSGETVGWGGVMFGYNGRPPDPLVFGEGWRKAWLERLEAPPLFLETWLRHQRRDDYWLQGSVCVDYSRIKIPVYAVSGWTDCWPNTVLRLMANLDVPRKGLSGSWGHMYPHFALPGPAAAFPQEALRWWDHWLKGIDNGIMDEPLLTCFIQDGIPPSATHSHRPGRWVDLPSWPPPGLRHRTFHLTDDGLRDAPASGGELTVSSPLSVGLMSGDYMPLDDEPLAAQMPSDQRRDDAKSVLFDSPPLEQELEFLGTPTATLTLASDVDCGLVALRLCDVAPDGSSSLITYGVLNLAQRNGRETPSSVEPGEVYEVTLRLNDVGHTVAAGHRLRVAVSNAYWPMAWPLPKRHALRLVLPGCSIALPQPEYRESDAGRTLFDKAKVAKPEAVETLRPEAWERTVEFDVESGRHVYRIWKDGGITRFTEIDLSFEAVTEEIFSIDEEDPQSARAEYRAVFSHARKGWQARTESVLVMTSSETDFLLNGRVEAFEDGERISTRSWDVTIPRDGF